MLNNVRLTFALSIIPRLGPLGSKSRAHLRLGATHPPHLQPAGLRGRWEKTTRHLAGDLYLAGIAGRWCRVPVALINKAARTIAGTGRGRCRRSSATWIVGDGLGAEARRTRRVAHTHLHHGIDAGRRVWATSTGRLRDREGAFEEH